VFSRTPWAFGTRFDRQVESMLNGLPFSIIATAGAVVGCTALSFWSTGVDISFSVGWMTLALLLRQRHAARGRPSLGHLELERGTEAVSCTTGGGGTCAVSKTLAKRIGRVTFQVTGVALDGYSYDGGNPSLTLSKP
jgi:hypothetical protein